MNDDNVRIMRWRLSENFPNLRSPLLCIKDCLQAGSRPLTQWKINQSNNRIAKPNKTSQNGWTQSEDWLSQTLTSHPFNCSQIFSRSTHNNTCIVHPVFFPIRFYTWSVETNLPLISSLMSRIRTHRWWKTWTVRLGECEGKNRYWHSSGPPLSLSTVRQRYNCR